MLFEYGSIFLLSKSDIIHVVFNIFTVFIFLLNQHSLSVVLFQFVTDYEGGISVDLPHRQLCLDTVAADASRRLFLHSEYHSKGHHSLHTTAKKSSFLRHHSFCPIFLIHLVSPQLITAMEVNRQLDFPLAG